MTDNAQISQLAAEVQAGRKYANISPDLIHRLAEASLQKRLKGGNLLSKMSAINCTRLAAQYFKHSPDYSGALIELAALPGDIHAESIQQFCLSQMGLHASTAERLPILEEFFQTCLASIAPVTSVLDLACGLTPLSIPWMPLAESFTYFACDIYADMLDFIQAFFNHTVAEGETALCDLIGPAPPRNQPMLRSY